MWYIRLDGRQLTGAEGPRDAPHYMIWYAIRLYCGYTVVEIPTVWLYKCVRCWTVLHYLKRPWRSGKSLEMVPLTVIFHGRRNRSSRPYNLTGIIYVHIISTFVNVIWTKTSIQMHTLWSIDILRKISKFDATRCQIFSLKCTKFCFRWGSAGGAYSAPPSPRAAFKGAYF